MNARRSTSVAYSPVVLRSLPDERLTELARDGSEAAFEVIVARHRRSLVRQCARILGEADAEEAVQEALLKAHAAIVGGNQVVRTLDPWLRTVARNTGLNMLRARGSRPTVSEDDGVGQQLTDSSAENREELQEVLSAVAALPARQREAMVLREFEGRSYEEIGARLGASDGAVRQLLNRARGAVRTRIGALAGFEPVLRWLVGNGAGEGTARVGALTGGCAISVKLCASVLPAVLVLGGSASPSPRRAIKPLIAARGQSARPHNSPGHVAAAVATGRSGARLMVASTKAVQTTPRRTLAALWKSAQPSAPPPAVIPQPSASPHTPHGRFPATPSAQGPAARTPQPGPSGSAGSAAPGDHQTMGLGAARVSSGQNAPTLTEATRRPAGPAQPPGQ
jgi:RNA polymerase sigma factor (sigma-70 family)